MGRSVLCASALVFAFAQDGKRTQTSAPDASVAGTSMAEDDDYGFEVWAKKFSKFYNGDSLRARRKKQFKATMASIEKFNLANRSSYKQGWGPFTDLNHTEFIDAAGIGKIPQPPETDTFPILGVHTHNGEELVSSVNWVDRGAVTPVQNQGGCPSCSVFSAVGAAEGIWQIKTGYLVNIAEQQVVDCCPHDKWWCGCCHGEGCHGWYMSTIWEWYNKEHVNVAFDSSYPYKALVGDCRTSGFAIAVHAGGITGAVHVNRTKNDLMSALQQQPVTIDIATAADGFHRYKSGVMDDYDGCGRHVGHAVLAVGYGHANGHDYWNIKNSWGDGWGDNGYIKLSSDTDVCFVLHAPQYPTAQNDGRRPDPSPSPSPPPKPRPSPSPSPSPSRCTDKSGWKNQDGDTCYTYEQYHYCTSNGGEGSGWQRSSWGKIENYRDRHGDTAMDACCACGGGSSGPSPTPGPSPNGSCENRCKSAGHCCTGRSSSNQHPSCAMGCAIAATMSDANECKSKCHKSDGVCDWVLHRTTKFDNCATCASGCDASGGVQDCLDGCDYHFDTFNSSRIVV